MMDFYLTNEEVDNFLRLINLNREDCSVDYLQKIIENTINNIPFQNLTMLCNNREIPDAEYIKKQMLSGAGGICTIRNPFIYKLLLNLGFDARLVASTIQRPDCHITIIVNIDGKLWWCDPGNGFPYFSLICLGDESEKNHNFLTYKLVKSDNRWELRHLNSDNEWFTNYSFDLSFVELNYFEEMYVGHYTIEGYGPFLTGLRYNLWSNDDWEILRDRLFSTKMESESFENFNEFGEWMNSKFTSKEIRKLIGTNQNIRKLWEVVA